jgi:hypothetical protein
MDRFLISLVRTQLGEVPLNHPSFVQIIQSSPQRIIVHPTRVTLDPAIQLDVAGNFARNMRVVGAFTPYNPADQRRLNFQFFASLRQQLSNGLFYATIPQVVVTHGSLLALW